MSRARLSVIGAFFVGGLLLFAVGLFMIGDRRLLFTEQVRLDTEFSRVRGVEVGTRVRVAGLDAGEVLLVRIPPGPGDRFRVTMRIREDLHHLVRTDSVVTIQTDGLLGSVYLDIGGGTAAAAVAPPGSLIEGRDAIEFGDLIEEGRDTFRLVAQEFLELRTDISGAIDVLTETAVTANELLDGVGSDVSRITAAGADVADAVEGLVDDAREVVEGIQAGQGTIGRLLTDDSLYLRLEQGARRAEASAASVQRTLEQLEQTVTGFRAEGGEGDRLMADAREALGYAREAMSDLAENTEALKRNWLFRGFFARRGFYNLRDLSVDEYRAGALERDGRIGLRVWIDAAGLFERQDDGSEGLSTPGRQRLESAMAAFLRYPRDSPLVVEGYSLEDAPDVRFLRAHARAEVVRDHLQRRYRRSATLTGIMPMGAAADESPRADGLWDGVALAVFVRGDAIGAARADQ